MAAEKILHAGKVEFERNGKVYFSADKIGFPEGLRLEKGDPVTLFEDSRHRLCVKPLVRATHAVARGKGRERESFTLFVIDGLNGPKVIASRPTGNTRRTAPAPRRPRRRRRGR